MGLFSPLLLVSLLALSLFACGLLYALSRAPSPGPQLVRSHTRSPPQPLQPGLVAQVELGPGTASPSAAALQALLRAEGSAVSKFTSAQLHNGSHSGPVLHAHIARGGHIPIVVLTCNRANLLNATLANLLNVRGVKAENVAIVQDGAVVEIKNVAMQYNIQLMQNTLGLQLRGGVRSDGGSRIATHYKFALSKAFDVIFPNAPAIIIVEDDLLFSPDFYDYFLATAPILDYDPSVFIISAWNDNGFKGKVKNPYGLKRTEFFPGLGWLLTRSLYKGELEHRWPTNHWDHWLRSPENHKGRDILYPQVPRTFHNGVKGTFMNIDTHNKYFRDIDYNLNPALSWTKSGVDNYGNELILPAYLPAVDKIYVPMIMQRMEKCTYVIDPDLLYDILLSKGMSMLQ
jgi:hypothetical protein